MSEYTRRNIQAAWAVHALTASGVFVGLLGLNAVIDGHARSAILWLIAALLLDGVDGPIARKLDVRNRIPTLNGNSLDLIVDYFTCAIVPVAFFDRFCALPGKSAGPVGFAILFVSALWMARTDQETEDGWFNGFPAEWSMIIPTLYLLHPNHWVTLGLCVLLCGLTLSRVQFAHPISVRQDRFVSITFMTLWLGSMLWLAILQHRQFALQIILAVAPMWTLVQVVRRAAKPGVVGASSGRLHTS